jgi:hypothetical protein
MNDRLTTAQVAYVRAFRDFPPNPFAISEDRQAEVLERAILAGRPVPAGFDWYVDLPPDAAA